MAMGTFGAFTQARLGIYAAQLGLSVTGNNISNINTPGYTRQRLNQVSLYVAGADRYYSEGSIRTGQGALVKSLSQIRSPYLDIRFREENAKVGYNNAMLEGLDAIARILDEVGKGDAALGEEGFGVLGLEINNLVSALQDVAKETGHQEFDNIVRQVAANLVSRLNSYAKRLEQVREDTVTSLKENVDEVNGLLTSIRTLNEEIRKSEIHGDPALELRDERNNLIDQLSGLIDINVTYSEEEIAPGLTVEKLTIRLGDANPEYDPENTDESLLVDGVFCAQLSWGTPLKNPYYGIELDKLTTEERQALIDELKGRDGFDAGAFKDDDEMLEAYVSSQYLYQEEDDNGNITAEKPVSQLKDATILTDENNPNFDLMITELKNKIGDLHVAIERGSVTKLTGGDPLAGITGAAWKNNSYTDTQEDTPSPGDTTITIYRRVQNGFEADGTTPKYEYTAQTIRQTITKPVALKDNDLGGEIQANRELLTEKGEFVDKSVIENIDKNAASKRGIEYYQRSLDLLAKQLAELFNNANQGFLMDKDGNYITEGTNDAGETVAVPVLTVTLTNPDGTTTEHALNKDDDLSDPALADLRAKILEELGLDEQEVTDYKIDDKTILNAYLKGQTYDTASHEFVEDENTVARGIFKGGVLFSNSSNGDDTTDINAANISISYSWTKSHILQRSFTCPVGELEPASGQSDNLTHMKYLLSEYKWVFEAQDINENAAPGPMFTGTIFEMWNNIGSTLGKDQKYTNTELTVAYESALSIDTDRDSVSSVDFNDEAMNLMMYAKSYNAACRMMTTLDSVLDKLINGTGVTT